MYSGPGGSGGICWSPPRSAAMFHMCCCGISRKDPSISELYGTVSRQARPHGASGLFRLTAQAGASRQTRTKQFGRHAEAASCYGSHAHTAGTGETAQHQHPARPCSRLPPAHLRLPLLSTTRAGFPDLCRSTHGPCWQTREAQATVAVRAGADTRTAVTAAGAPVCCRVLQGRRCPAEASTGARELRRDSGRRRVHERAPRECCMLPPRVKMRAFPWGAPGYGAAVAAGRGSGGEVGAA